MNLDFPPLDSTPNMTGRRFQRTMDMILVLPWLSTSPSVSTPIKQSTKNKRTQGVRARYDADLPPCICTIRHPGPPVILGMEFSLCNVGKTKACRRKSGLTDHCAFGLKVQIPRQETHKSMTQFEILCFPFEFWIGRGMHWTRLDYKLNSHNMSVKVVVL